MFKRDGAYPSLSPTDGLRYSYDYVAVTRAQAVITELRSGCCSEK